MDDMPNGDCAIAGMAEPDTMAKRAIIAVTRLNINRDTGVPAAKSFVVVMDVARRALVFIFTARARLLLLKVPYLPRYRPMGCSRAMYCHAFLKDFIPIRGNNVGCNMANVKMLAFDVIVFVYVAIAFAVFVPWLLLSAWGPTPMTLGVSDAVYRFFSVFCHQLPSRSLFFDGIQMPVCARCASIYAATGAGLLFLRLRGYGPREFKMNWLLFALLLAPTGLDGTTQWLGWRESTNSLRLVTGVPYGLGYAYVLAWAVPFVYALLELVVVAARRDWAGTDAVLGRIKFMAWPFTTGRTEAPQGAR
jgi:uncharacterized membrane protein